MRLLIIFLFFFSAVSISHAQPKTNLSGTIQRIKVHGQSLEGNLNGDSADRNVSIYLPASYASDPNRRYPVVYFLHGYTDDDAKFFGLKHHWMVLPPILDSVFAKGAAREMIVVMPDAYTKFQGSMYSSSVTTGDWETFICKELVSYIDQHYRTLPNSESRGLCGHSMGGYGALRIGEKFPDVFSVVYLLSPCCLDDAPTPGQHLPANFFRADSIKTIGQFNQTDFGTRIIFASAAAWSPNPVNPPFFVDLPVKEGQLQASVLQKWTANRPLNTLDQYIFNIKKLRGIGFDAGTRDPAIAASIRTLHAELNRYGVPHFFEVYEGTHTSHVADRIENKMLSFFSERLVFDSVKK